MRAAAIVLTSERVRTLCAVLIAICGWLGPRPAYACGWDWETFAAEAARLPCVSDLVIGAFATHTPEYYETTVQATDLALAWAPYYAEALDAKGMALVHLGRHADAEPVLRARALAAPDAYASHANLGTLFTFNGQYGPAIEHVDKALALEPKAHFGREKYHRALLVFIQNKPANPTTDFLGLSLSDEQRYHGSVQAFERAGLNVDVFDALASMIAVYGAESFADLYYALGDVLALRGEIKLAWAAYRRATELKHPSTPEIERYMGELVRIVDSAARKRARQRDQERELNLPGARRGLDAYYRAASAQAAGRRSDYHQWERIQLKRGLRPWVNEHIERSYRRMDQLKERCKTPGLIQGQAAPNAPVKETP